MSRGLAHGLRQMGLDVTTTQELSMESDPDDVQLAYCIQQERILVTSDYDFIELDASGIAHPGIVFIQYKHRKQIGKLLQFFESLLTRDPGALCNQVHYSK